MLGEIELAEHALDEAVSAAEQAGDDELAADAHLALAGVLSIAGRWPAAFAHLDEVDRLGSKELRGIAELQRAALCSDAGRIDEALRLLAGAIPRLRRQKNSLHLARMLANRGGIRVGRGELAAAIADFEEAEALYRSVGQEFAAMQTRHDLGCAFATIGDLPRALQLFDEVSARFVELGHDASVPLLSRAEALLLGGLSADALVVLAGRRPPPARRGQRLRRSRGVGRVAEAAGWKATTPTAIDAASPGPAMVRSPGDPGLGASGRARGDALRSTRATASTIPRSTAWRRSPTRLSAAGDVRGELTPDRWPPSPRAERGGSIGPSVQGRLAAPRGAARCG